MTDERKDQLTAEADGLIEGRNAVIEALRTEASIDKIFIQKGEVDKTLGHIASKARAAGIVVVGGRQAEAGRHEAPTPPRRHRSGSGAGVRQCRRYSGRCRRQERVTPDRGVRPSQTPTISCHHPDGLLRRRPRRGHSQAPQCGIDQRGGQDLRRRGVSHEGGSGAHIPSLLKDLKKQGGSGYSARRPTAPPYQARRGPGGSAAAIVIGGRGGRHDPSGCRKLRFSGEHPHEG